MIFIQIGDNNIMKYDRNILVDNINILISDNNITQSDLAKIIGTHQSRLSECLNKKKDFTLPQVVAIADYFKVSLDDLLNRPSRTISCPDTLSELCEYFFALTDFIDFDISHQDVDTSLAPCDLYDKLECQCLNGISYDEAHSECFSVLSLVLLNESIIAFLDEWKSAISLLKFSNGFELYETWKKGILAKYKNNLKIYQYRTEAQYANELIKKKYDYCFSGMESKGYKENDFTEEPILKAEWEKFSKKFNLSCSDTDRKLLEQFDDDFNNCVMLPFYPSSSDFNIF